MPPSHQPRAIATESPPLPNSAAIASPGEGLTVVGVGASAGGLEALGNFLDAVPADSRLSLILVQHLGPSPEALPETLMAELLAKHTLLPVQQASEGMPLRPGTCTLIPPAIYLSVSDGRFRLSPAPAQHGARLPFDFLLSSLAAEYGDRAACVVLSGNGADGSAGLLALAGRGGLVLVQTPEEAGYDGMPRSAIATGAADHVLPVADMPAALLRFAQRTAESTAPRATGAAAPDCLLAIVELLRTRTVHDFGLYKLGTIRRGVERRMVLASLEPGAMGDYLALLRRDPAELDLLARNLLINVTSFFRDSKVFEYLETKVIPGLVRDHPPGQRLRIWIAGCSTGEETYSLAMLFVEQIEAFAATAGGHDTKLQVFASDVDPDAIARARAGHYPAGIEDVVGAPRLGRFFSRDETGYRVLPDLRNTVVFTVQDVLADPPFSRLDMVSCRNLLIYLRPEAQARVIALFHFALRTDGVLLLGNAEVPGSVEGRFEAIGKAERVYRHIGRSRPGDVALLSGPAAAIDGAGAAAPIPGQTPLRPASLAELGRRVMLDSFAPAAVIITPRHECLYQFGATDRYLRPAPGHATHDLLSMTRPGTRTALRDAIRQANAQPTGQHWRQHWRVVVRGGRTVHGGRSVPFDLDIQPIGGADENLLLVCFVDRLHETGDPGGPAAPAADTAALERELEAMRTELQGAIRDLENSTEEQKAVNEETLSVNEEYQSTNEELLTSKEELQSLNEELTALNSQLQESLERQRTTADDLQNVLYSTDVATLFLDAQLNIRFFTPATRSLFRLIAGDVGRPLSDLSSQAIDPGLAADAQAVLDRQAPIECEIEKPGGRWFLRRILPYRSHAGAVEGVVITFNDITERKRVKEALRAATRKAELASLAKSRFLAAASHDLRQPLQTLTLLHGLLSKPQDADRTRTLLGRFGETLTAMTGMLDTLLGINQIEAGVVAPEIVAFPVGPLLQQLGRDFALLAETRSLSLRVMPCSLGISSDPRLLEQILRNLVANAIKYTKAGRILLGCRRYAGGLSIQVVDTGVGIPAHELRSIFDEYHQVAEAGRARSPGLGLGLSIVQRLGDLLGHAVRVRSTQSRGSVFSIDVPLAVLADTPETAAVASAEALPHRTGAILLIEDDPDLSDLLATFLEEEGHRVSVATSGLAALDLVAHGAIRPDLVLTDFNLPGGLDGLRLTARLRSLFGAAMPVIVLTGEISAQVLQDVAGAGCKQLYKPVKLHQLTETIQRLLPSSGGEDPHGAADGGDADAAIVFVVDDDAAVRDAVCALLTHDGRKSRAYASCSDFLAAFRAAPGQCLLIDGHLPEMDGITLLRHLRAAGQRIPTVMMTGNSDVRMAVEAMQAGASDFVEKPIGGADLLASLQRALDEDQDCAKLSAWQQSATAQLATLTARQREIMTMVLDGHPSKNIAADLHISQRTVENHRAAIMHKTGSASLPALARLALAAAGTSTAPGSAAG